MILSLTFMERCCILTFPVMSDNYSLNMHNGGSGNAFQIDRKSTHPYVTANFLCNIINSRNKNNFFSFSKLNVTWDIVTKPKALRFAFDTLNYPFIYDKSLVSKLLFPFVCTLAFYV